MEENEETIKDELNFEIEVQKPKTQSETKRQSPDSLLKKTTLYDNMDCEYSLYIFSKSNPIRKK